ncbi:GNAT family N-acetyltransferase [Brachybacterium sp. FME24]|uniref:GNAT family N-acetyltransferase n=1 Tax=Brachybacterium sp. FME24 TaxID=2742605 RepID=UPI0018691CBF|nr:GNAT family N-acetyltransferase [Brachybacterium sp. FME24]
MDETSAGPGAVRLVHDDDRDRYKAMDGSEVVGVLYYGDEATDPGATGTDVTRVVRDLRSTVVAPDRSGHGVGSALVRLALDDAREHELRVRATCWFVRGWIQRHPEYADLLETPVTDEGKGPR